MSSRDDFSQTTKNLLATQVALLCSFPGCGALTQGPHTNSDKRTNVGVAAHICAAAPGGPRYDPNMSKAERKSPENGIWMCHTHGTLIDNDYQKYSVAELHRWKKDAIARAETGVGRKLITEAEAQQQGMSLVAQFAQNTLGVSDKTTLIRHVHQSATDAMERLDPRFKVTSSFSGEATEYTIEAKENAELTLQLPAALATKIERLQKYGEPADLQPGEFNIAGSQLFADIKKHNASLHISPHKTNAELTLEFLNKDGSVIGPGEFAGYTEAGSEAIKFTGDTFGRLLTFTFQAGSKRQQANFSLSINYEQWEGKPLTRLSYLSKMLKFMEAMEESSDIKLHLHYEGEPAFSALVDFDKNKVDVLVITKFLSAARYICEKTGQKIQFQMDRFAFSEKDFRDLLNIESLLREKQHLRKQDLQRPITLKIVFEEERRDQVFEYLNGKVKNFIELEQGINFELMGQNLSLPDKRTSIKNVIPSTETNISTLKNGDELDIVLIPQDDFSLTIEFTEEPT